MMEFLQAYAQILGVAGAVIGILRYQFKEPQHVKLLMALASVFFLFHYWGMGYESVALLCVLGLLRSFLLSTNIGMAFRLSVLVVGLISGFCVGLLGQFYWDAGLLVWLPVLGFSLNLLAEVQVCDLRMRVAYFAAPLASIFFNLLIGSFGGSFANLLSISSNTLGIYRHHYRKKSA